MIALALCSACGNDAAKLRVGSLGDTRGVWCTQCGDSTDDVAQWQARGVVRQAISSTLPRPARGAGAGAEQLYPITYHLPTSSGAELDRIAGLHGLVREVVDVRTAELESDDALRARIRSQYVPPKGTP